MTRRIMIYGVTIFLAVILQSTLLQYVAIYDIKPDFLVIFILFISLKEGSKWGELFGFFSGLLIDFLSLSPLGFFAMVYCCVGFVMGLTNKNITTDSLLTQWLFILFSILLKYFLSSFLIILFSIETTTLMFIGRNFLIEASYTMAVVPFVFTLANRIYIIGKRNRTGF